MITSGENVEKQQKDSKDQAPWVGVVASECVGHRVKGQWSCGLICY